MSSEQRLNKGEQKNVPQMMKDLCWKLLKE